MGRDYLEEYDDDDIQDLDDMERQAQQDFKDNIWTTQDCREFRVKDMTYNHISNTINMLRRTGGRLLHQDWIDKFEAEIEKRQAEGIRLE